MHNQECAELIASDGENKSPATNDEAHRRERMMVEFVICLGISRITAVGGSSRPFRCDREKNDLANAAVQNEGMQADISQRDRRRYPGQRPAG